MAITGKYGHFICDTELERASLTANTKDPEGFECLVKTTPSRFYKYIGGAWQLIGGAVIVTSDTLPSDFNGLAHYFVRINATEDGYEYFAVVPGAGDLLSSNNLSDLADTDQGRMNLNAQEADADLDAIAALNSATAGVIANTGSGWLQKTFAQLKTLLALVAADVGLGSVVNADTTTTANITDSTNKRFVTDADSVKLGFVSVTQPVDLDQIESRVNDLDAAVVLKGTWDASAGTFPGGGTAQAGASYIVSVAGTVDGVSFNIGDRIIAILDNASTGTFASNWFKADYTDQVLSVNGATGAVTLTTANVADSLNKRYVTDANLTTIGNQSGTNSGDETAQRIGNIVNAAAAKTSPVNADMFPLMDSVTGNIVKKFSWADMVTKIIAALAGTYAALSGSTLTSTSVNGVTLSTAEPATQYLDNTGAYSTPSATLPALCPNHLSQTADYTLADNYSITVPKRYKIGGTSFLKLAGASVFKIS